MTTDADFGMLETDALQSVMQLDIDAEIVGIELQFVAGTQMPPSSCDVHGQRGYRAFERDAPVLDTRGVGLIIHGVGLAAEALRSCAASTNSSYSEFACSAAFNLAKLSSTVSPEVSICMSASGKAARVLPESAASLPWPDRFPPSRGNHLGQSRATCALRDCALIHTV